jgi:hypothetical protein
MVNATPVIGLQMFAVGMHQQIPSTIFNENSRAVMKQIPPYKIEVLLRRGSIDG